MLPLHQAEEVRDAVRAYLHATFGVRDAAVREALFGFLDGPDGLFQGPWVQVQLPFRTEAAGAEVPLEIKPAFPPFVHQARAFARLSTRGQAPQPTLLTTGTGSGKTEAFLYPLLDYAHAQRHRPGIKALLLYPMNALATDQAQRIAQLIHADPRLHGLTAGLFIGEGDDPSVYSPAMQPTRIIEQRRRLLEHPPDLLLTNFKMLDFGLLRARYQPLWRHNRADPALLQFLVLDELHTYDGAQGTDVAHLVRRLKMALGLPRGHLCPVGTSATLGEGEEAEQKLRAYASAVFGEAFPAGSVLGETRIAPHDFFRPRATGVHLPPEDALATAARDPAEPFDAWMARLKALWGTVPDATPEEVGHELMRLQAFSHLVTVASTGLYPAETLLARWADAYAPLHRLSVQSQRQALHTLLALTSWARRDGRPLVFVRVAFWMREMSGILREVRAEPAFRWRETPDPPPEAALPFYVCRECGATGWLSEKRDDHSTFVDDSAAISAAFFDADRPLYLLTPDAPELAPHPDAGFVRVFRGGLHPETLAFTRDEVPPGTVPILAMRRPDGVLCCPECATPKALTLVGARTATLASVATSQVLSSPHESRPEGRRKVLAFTNSVQDAAHRAGFIQARGYRFAFRTALQHAVRETPEETTLADLTAALPAVLREAAGSDDAFLHRFYPDDCERRAPLEDLLPAFAGRLGVLVEALGRRLTFEALSEYGFMAPIGRTLEKTGASGVYVPEARLRAAVQQLAPWLHTNELDATFPPDGLVPYLETVLARMRHRAGFHHALLLPYRTESLDLFGLNGMKRASHLFARRYGKASRIPRLLTPHATRTESLDSSAGRTASWFNAALKKAFPNAFLPTNVSEAFHAALFEACAHAGLLHRAVLEKSGTVTYALDPAAYRVSQTMRAHTCGSCGHVRYHPAEGVPPSLCVRHGCSGRYGEGVPMGASYYAHLYTRALAPRVKAHEHTGLLERGVRERVEREFKRTADEPRLNALVATSTLEMGIDIGALDVVFNLGLPPLPANYLQRIGRAGRASGNALVLNVASARSQHDQFLWADPMHVMAGAVHPPGCFLNAPEILRRQFLARVLDHWAAADPARHHLPDTVKRLALRTSHPGDGTFFTDVILAWLAAHREALLGGMEAQYGADLQPERLAGLREACTSGAFQAWLEAPFTAHRLRLLALAERRRELHDRLKQSRLGREDSERKHLDDDVRALAVQMRHYERQHTLEFMTEMGLLPNYAFPEAGVTLSVRVQARTNKELNVQHEPEQRAYVRPAEQALRELVPHSTFYAEGYALPVSGLDVATWAGDQASLVQMRFCSRCDTLRPAAETSSTPCPSCGDASFGSATNVHAFARLTGSRSEIQPDRARLDDSRDEREPVYWNLSQHARFHRAPRHHHVLKKVPFGVEFLTDVDLTTVNLGRKEEGGTHLTVNGRDRVPRHGFITCRTCGYSTNRPEKEGQADTHKPPFHYRWCPHRAEAYAGEPHPVFEEAFLTRTFRTEVLRLYLPTQEVDADAIRLQFKAGLSLGLRHYFGGHPSHLAFQDYVSFHRESGKPEQFLLLYDRVPGGTGYLERLSDPETFTDVLKTALEHLETCACQHRGLDGCYVCVRSYQNQRDARRISRAETEAWFRTLVKQTGDWDVGASDGRPEGGPLIEESELERRFVQVMEQWAHATPGAKVERPRDGDGQAWVLHVPHRTSAGLSGKSIVYRVQAQQHLGRPDGLGTAFRADFVARPLRIDGDAPDAHDLFPTWVIELDGFAYHASEAHWRLENDLERRTAVQADVRHRMMVFTWDDFERHAHARGDAFWPDAPGHASARVKLAQLPAVGPWASLGLPSATSIDRWFVLLSLSPEDQRALTAAWACMASPFPPRVEAGSHLAGLLREVGPGPAPVHVPERGLVSGWSRTARHYRMCVVANPTGAGLFGRLAPQFPVRGPIDREDWADFWRAWTLLAPCAPFVAGEALEEDPVDDLLPLFSDELHALLRALVAEGMPFNREGGHTLMEDGTVVAEAELGFDDARVVFLPLDEASAERYVRAGYTVADPATFSLSRLRA